MGCKGSEVQILSPRPEEKTPKVSKTFGVFLKNMIEFVPIGPINRKAVLSAVASVLGLVALALDFIPVPFTFLVCYPASVLLGIVALATGITSLIEIGQTEEKGRTLAWIGIWVGGLTILATICLFALGVSLWPHIRALIQQFWHQIWN